MKKEAFQRFSNLLFFENHLEDEKAQFLATQHGYLFRRDSARLVAHALPTATEKAKHFPMQDIENGMWDGVQLIHEELLFANEAGAEHRVPSVGVPYETHSLQTLFWKEFDTVFRIETKSLVKVLLILQRKLLNQKLALHEVDIMLDWQAKTLSLLLPNETSSYDLSIEVDKAGEETQITYAYLFFKDFFMHANSFNKQLTFSIYQSYFTKIDYDEKTKAVLNHKRKSV